MTIINRREPLLLLLGDVFVLLASLWITLFIRFQGVPDTAVFSAHLAPFSALFAAWILVYFITGLYERHSSFIRSRLPMLLLNAQIINVVGAVVFFYFFTMFGIAPKTILFIYLAISLVLMTLWRVYGQELIATKRQDEAVLIASGPEGLELYNEVNRDHRYLFRFVAHFDTASISGKELVDRIAASEACVVVIDWHDDRTQAILPELYQLMLKGVSFIDMSTVYEDTFRRVPLSLLREAWFLENISTAPKFVYDALKRMMDISIAILLGIPSLFIFPFAWLAIKLDDGGKAFIIQERVGKGGKIIRIYKFRTMNTDDKGVWITQNDNRHSRVGPFLRKSRIDELPQLWNVLRGDLSLIGPRPDLLAFGEELARQIPYYAIRNTIAPGLSGWAQIYQKPPQTVEENKLRLAYDLFYVKNRSFFLDLRIAARTVMTLLSRTGL